MMKIRFLVSFLIMAGTSFAQGLDTLQLPTIFQEPYLAGVRPSFIRFQPDGKQILFAWNDSALSKRKTFSVDLSGKKVSPFTDTNPSRATVSPDGKYSISSEKGDLFLNDLKKNTKTQLTQTKAFEFGATWSPDSKRIAFAQDGNIWVMNILTPGVIQVTNKKEDEPGYSVSAWLGNHDLILSQYDSQDNKEYYFPEYIGKYVKSGATNRGVSKITLSHFPVDSNKKSEVLFSGQGWMNTAASANDKDFVFTWLDPFMKQYSMYAFNTTKEKAEVIYSDSTKGWFESSSIQFSPKGDYVLFESEKDGWNHLYKIQADGSGLTQLTKGAYEVSWYEYLNDNEMLIVTNEVDPGERQVYRFNLKTLKQTRITKAEGFRKGFRLSPDKKTLVYEKTFWNQPFDLYALDLKSGKETQLTHSTPERFNKINWQTPEYWRFTGRDKETDISMTLLKPQNYQSGKKYPVVVFVHGAGSLQNVYKGWSENYWREYMFHQFLNQNGYVVIEVDYRHSTGYGRKFREDVTGWMGKFETEDIIDGLDYAQKQTNGMLDLDKVGIYGGSYGGFMSLYAVSVAPERFHAAAALRAVTNWANYYYTNPWYTGPRLGTPEENPENYKRSSPLSFADTLKRPVYILHGLIDNNVGFQDAAQYIERLIQTGNKHFDMMMYPSERHSFTDPDSWTDEYSRIFHFFERELK